MLLITRKQKQKHLADLISISRKRSQLKDTMRRLFKNKLSIIGLVIIVLLLVTIFAPLFTKFPYDEQNFIFKFQMPTLEHPFGTDNFGRDILSRVLFGGRISLLVAVVSVTMSTGVGVAIGSVAGYFGGITDTVISRILDIIMAIPALLLAITVSAALVQGQ
jgi:peptide/nickel transport system permease protein